MKTNVNYTNTIDDLAKAGVESAEAACVILGRDDWLRDRLPLPSATERERWLALWSDDKLAWEATIEQVLGHRLAAVASQDEHWYIAKSFDSIRQFFDRDWPEFDSFFRSLEVRFVLRVFLPCLARTYQRPSTILRAVVGDNECEFLETIVQIDPTVLHHTGLAAWLNPASSGIRYEHWQLLQPSLVKPTADVERRQVKYGISAFLRQTTKRCGRQITLSMLLRMFNAVAATSGKGLRDPDFTHDPSTFQKGVRRFGSRLPHFC